MLTHRSGIYIPLTYTLLTAQAIDHLKNLALGLVYSGGVIIRDHPTDTEDIDAQVVRHITIHHAPEDDGPVLSILEDLARQLLEMGESSVCLEVPTGTKWITSQ